MHFAQSSCTLEWELMNFDPFVRNSTFEFAVSDDPPLAAWYNFNYFYEL